MKVYADCFNPYSSNGDFFMVAPQPERDVTTPRDSGRGFRLVTRKGNKKPVVDNGSRKRVNDRLEPFGVYTRYAPSDLYAKRRVAPSPSIPAKARNGTKKFGRHQNKFVEKERPVRKEGYPFHKKNEERKLRKDALTFGLDKLFDEELRNGPKSKPNGLFEDMLQSVLRFYNDAKESSYTRGGFRCVQRPTLEERRVMDKVEKQISNLDKKGVFGIPGINKKYPVTKNKGKMNPRIIKKNKNKKNLRKEDKKLNGCNREKCWRCPVMKHESTACRVRTKTVEKLRQTTITELFERSRNRLGKEREILVSSYTR